MAEKTPTSAVPNVHHRSLVLAELMGTKIEMSHRAVINAGELRQMPDGSIGVHVEEFPEQAALLRWMNHDFLEVERASARAWREELAAHDPARLIGILKNVLPTDTKLSDLGSLKAFIDSFCSRSDREVVDLALHVLGVSGEYERFAVRRWLDAGRPSLSEFAPYSTHVFEVELLFYLGIHRGFISGERSSNRADMAYLYYLPFTMVFVSGDGLHRRTAPLFLREDQSYLEARDLKSALHELDTRYNRLPDDIKALGVMVFASYPPSDADDAVGRLWDKHMRPDWRAIASARETSVGKPRDEEADHETLDELRNQLEEAQPVTGGPSISAPIPDYAFVTRTIPPMKGKWRILPKHIGDER